MENDLALIALGAVQVTAAVIRRGITIHTQVLDRWRKVRLRKAERCAAGNVISIPQERVGLVRSMSFRE